LACLIDGVIVISCGGVFAIIAAAIIGAGMGIAGFERETDIAAATSAGRVVALATVWLYYALLESSSRQATIGKMALGIIVIDEEGGQITFGKATVRYFAKILSALLLFVGYLMVAFTQRKQGLHDLIAETLVINKEGA